jgi:hypothetical protein
MSEQLVQLYQNMADMTAPECAGVGPGSCRVPHSCCDEMACTITKQYAAEKGVTTLPEYPPNHKGAFYLSETGCTVSPHLRPHCTLHTCSINGMGFKPGDAKWTEDYFELREEIEQLETLGTE